MRLVTVLWLSCFAWTCVTPHAERTSQALPHANPIASGHAAVNGITMYYEEYGKKDGTPLVLLHGGGSTIQSTFGHVIPILAIHHRLIAVEEQAHGRSSDRNTPVRFDSSADDVAALLKTLNIDRADLFGWSNGASVAMQVAIRHPAKVRKLIFASSFTKRSAAPDGFWAFMKSTNITQMPQPLKDAFLKVNPDPAKLQIMHDKDADRMNHFPDVPDQDISSIKADTLIISGDRDLPKIEHSVELAKLIPKARLLILPSGHGDYLGEITTTPNQRLIESSVGLIDTFLASP